MRNVKKRVSADVGLLAMDNCVILLEEKKCAAACFYFDFAT